MRRRKPLHIGVDEPLRQPHHRRPMNRREFTEKGVILGVNPRGPVDRSVPVLRVTNPDGKVLAVLFGAACHNTTLGPKDYRISGDFAGFAQEHHAVATTS